MKDLAELKNRISLLSEKHEEYYKRLIWDECLEESDCGLQSTTFEGVDKFLKDDWIETYCEDINQVIFQNGVESLKRTRESIVKTVSKHRTQANQEIPGKFSPEVYEILMTIFQNVSSNERMIYFHTLIDYYYLKFSESVKSDLNLNVVQILPLIKYEEQIKVFLPIVKLDMLNEIYTKSYSNMEEKNELLKQLTLEIYEYFKIPEFLREDCYKILEDQIGPYSCIVTKFETEIIKKDRSKSKLIIHYKQNNNEMTRHYLMNFAHEKLALRTYISETFARQEFIYSIFIPKLKQLGFKDISLLFPKCCFLRSKDVIVLEDLTNHLDVPIEFATANVAIKQLAKFHSCSVLFEEKFSQVSKRVASLDEETKEYFHKFSFVTNEKILSECIENLIDFILDYCEFEFTSGQMTRETFKEKSKTMFLSVVTKLNKSDNYRNVICHFNSYTSNFIFNKDLNLCRLTNFQAITYFPPVADLLLFLYSNTSKESRGKSISDYLHAYYEELSNSLKSYSIDINQIYSYRVFLECCSFFKPIAVCLALCPIEFLCTAIKDGRRILNWRDAYEDIMKRNYVDELRMRELIDELKQICEKCSN